VWDKEFLPKQVELSIDDRQLYLTEEEYVFRTVYGNTPFNEGIHYWEIVADARSEHEIKTGIATKREKNQDASFSDFQHGWAFFGIGALRHNSNSQGPNYGKPFKRQGILGIFLNMNKGTLSFAIDGQYFGLAFSDEKLKQGPIYPAVSLLHNAGCILVTNKHPPSYFFD
jgi:E3 ubiquitin-protein ligase NRDP1